MVLDEIPDYPSNSATPLLTSVEIANMSVRQKMQQELQNSRESVLQMEQLHQQEITGLKEMLEAAKIERRNERNQLQQKINSLQKELEASKRKMKNMGRDHVVLIERTKEAEQVAQKIEVDSIQSKMLLGHEQDINKLKKIHKTEMIKLQQLLKEKEQEVKLFSQQLHEEREMLASVKLQLEECRHDNHIKVNKMKSELASKTENYHRQVKKEKSLAVAKALEEANLQKNKELHELQLKCQEDKMVALNKMERKFTTQLAEGLQRKEQVKRDHVVMPTQEGCVNNKHVERIIQDHSSEKVKWQQKVHQLEQELQQCKNEMKLIQQQHKEASHQHDKENKAVAMEIMEECHKISTLLMKRLRSGKNPITSCWAAIVQLKNTNEELANQIKELRTRLEQEKQCAVKANRERLTEFRKLQKSSTKRKSHEEQQLEKQITSLNNQLMILNKEHLLLEAKVSKLRT